MTTLTFLLVGAALSLALATRLRAPAAPVAIVAGVAMSGAPLDEALVTDGLLLAATFLVFAVGTQLERQASARYRPAAIGIAALYLGATAVIALAVAPLLDVGGFDLVYLVLALGSSSTLLVVDLLRRRRQSFDAVGRLTTGIAVTQDVVVIAALALLGPAALGARELAYAALAAAGLAALAWACARWLAPAALVRGHLSGEEELLVVLAVLFAFVGVAWGSGLPVVLGAYLAGVVFSRFPVGSLVRGHVASFADFFNVLFFVQLGALVGVPRPHELVAEAILILAVLVLRPFLLLPILRRLKLTVRASMQSMTMLAQSGEVGLIVFLVAIARGHVDEGLLSTVAAVVMVTMALVPALSSDRVVWWLTHAYPRRRRAPPAGRKGHVILIGAGEGGRAVLADIARRGAEVVVVDGDPAVIDRLAAEGVAALRGEGGDPHVLREVEAERAAAIISTMRRPHDNERLLAAVETPRVLVRVFSAAEAERMRARGALPVVESELAARAFLDWAEAARAPEADA